MTLPAARLFSPVQRQKRREDKQEAPLYRSTAAAGQDSRYVPRRA